ncbi:MAG TPA: amino acid adenylation domain-containing protein, partial [Stenomitos sp.]
MTQQILGFRLSPLQQRLWQRYEHQPSSGYRTEMVIHLNGFVDRFRLARAVKLTLDRHEILRTRFESLPELTLPLQVVTHPKEALFTVENLLQNEPTDALEALADHKPETLSQPLTVRFISKGQQHQLRLSLSPLCGDSKTLTLLAAEIQQAYAINSANTEATEPLQYADLAEWQHDLLANEQTQQGRAFWRQLDYAPLNGLHLPGDCSSASPSFDVCQVQIAFSAATGQRLQNFAREEDCSVAAPFLAAWQVLLSRMAGQTSFLLGVGTDGRPYPDLHQTLGLCDQIVPLACEVCLEETVHTALHRIDRSLEACQGWQGYFDWESVTDLLPNGESEVLNTRIPNLDYCFEWISLPTSLMESPQHDALPKFAIAELESHTEPFKLKLTVTVQGNTLKPILYFNPHCFDRDTICQLTARYQTLLQGMLEMPDSPVGQVPWLSPADLEVLASFDAAPEIPALPESIHQYFEAQVKQTPDSIALRWDAESLAIDGIPHAAVEMTYAELNARANQLAHYLRSQGVCAGEFIGLCVPRSPVMVIAILGILKAGAAYVPLDATYPLERLTQIVNEAALARLVVCGLEERLLACLKGESRTLLDLTCIETDLDLQSTSDLPTTATGSDIAYLIFTSGSTGVPKGVQITHSNLCHYAWAMQRAIGLQADDVYLHTASIAFSSSVRQLMVPLCLGATVVIATQTQRTDAITLLRAVKAHRVTVVDWVPSLWRHCLQEALALAPEIRHDLLDNALRLILSASEPLPADLPIGWRTVLNHPARVINMYGQTETCGIVAVYPVPYEGISGIVPLGRPITNTRFRLVDAMGQLVPVGVVGELQVSGPGVGPGYFQRPDLTARSFSDDMHPANTGVRWYKTGDLARFRTDGTLEFVSRGDRQVKIRGVRVELGEIESVLLQHPQVSEAAVIAVKSEGESLPVGFAILKASGIAERDLMIFLQQRLPRPMMPAQIRILCDLPLTPNGKLDRLALQQMALEPDAPQQDWQEVRSPIQELLAGIWCQLLHRDCVGTTDDFFALGGHSLLATQLVSRVRAVFAVELPLRAIFEAPTLAGLSDRISELRRQEAPQLLTAIAPVPHTLNATFPLSFAQQQLWVFEQFALHTSTYHLSRALQLKGYLDVEALKRSFQALIQRHTILRTRFLVGDMGPVQVIEKQPTLPWIEVDLRDPQTLAPLENWQAIAHESLRAWSQKPFDLSAETPLRLVWLRGSETESVLLVTLHHIIADGWSASVFIRELAALYEAERNPSTNTSGLPALPLQYVDFALWQRQTLQQDALAASFQYWETKLQQPLPVLSLPSDWPRSQHQTFRGKTALTSLPDDRVVALKNFSRSHGVTPFMTLLATFQVLLWRLTTETDFAIGVPIANRTHPQTEGLIGCFTNTLVLRTPLDPAQNFLDLLANVRTTTLEAYSHQDLPFEKLVERLQPERDRSHSPLFQVFFALQNVPTETLTLSGLTLSTYPLESTTARYDLSLTWDEVGSELRARWEYNCDLFDDSTVVRWMERYRVLLDEILADPDRLIHRLPWLSEAERYQVCVVGNQTQVAHSGERHLHRAVEQQVARQPDAIALEMGEHRLTYDALNRRANQIAHALLALGVEGNALVGLCLKRSPEMVAAVLGILKAGCAYVPLDPCYPKERLAQILEDSAIQCLVTQSTLLNDLPPVPAPILDCTTLGNQDWPDCNLERVVAADALAYVIYTSGSTGQPKGVQ